MGTMGDETQPLWRRAATHTLHTSLLLKMLLEERLQEAEGLLLADNEALLNSGHADEPLRMSDIAHRLVLSRGGTTKVIDRLEGMGYVSRRPDTEDRRATVVELTRAGRNAAKRARAVINAGLEEIWSAHLTDDESTVLIDVMDRVLAANHECC